MDSQDVADAFPKLNSLKVFDWKIGVTHDPNGLESGKTLEEEAIKNGFHVFVYGHTHLSDVRWEDNLLYINPGSPTDPVSVMHKPTVGLLKLTKEIITPQIIEL
jgi:predicted phosphodiesterase